MKSRDFNYCLTSDRDIILKASCKTELKFKQFNTLKFLPTSIAIFEELATPKSQHIIYSRLQRSLGNEWKIFHSYIYSSYIIPNFLSKIISFYESVQSIIFACNMKISISSINQLNYLHIIIFFAVNYAKSMIKQVLRCIMGQ